jgi:hypothetical protein
VPGFVLVKIALAVSAIFANLGCGVLVVRRHRRIDDVAALRRTSRHIRYTWAAVPLGLGALYLGFRLVG